MSLKVFFCFSEVLTFIVFVWREASFQNYIYICKTTHMLSIERADWPKLHDMFKHLTPIYANVNFR